MSEKQYLYGGVNYTSLIQAHTDNVRDTFRETAKLKLITSSEVWFSYLDKRNITVHTYRKEILDGLFFSITKEFLKDLDYFLARLEKEAPKVKNQAKEYSDLDLCYYEEISWNTFGRLKEDLEKSYLPFKVDLVY
ncbi:24915_t:CDS:2 [Entrophospora sp. SA101]|nr:14084_t:CDS:2 [Entrophospora sp. SA101]CAJ0747061.1 24915_t:CDS:2 [Entrophospora sp. SA101]CAJ0830357.1 1836_t:CDS:2 [Entrophospora sp. SA101]CAJ0836330.1 2064_t:CDS:2 [Entrophospora sp. SA101]